MSITELNLQTFEKEILQSPRTSYNVQLKLYDFFIPVLGVTIILLNLMVVLSSGLILHKRQQPRSTYIFLGNVALADTLIGVATIFGNYYPKIRRTEMVCCASIGMIIASTLASIYSVGLIAVDRFLYIMFGMQYQRYLSSKRARVMVLGTWLLGGFVGFLPAMGVRNSTENGLFCWLIILEPAGLVLATVTIGLVPLIVIIILYSIILKTALGKISEMRNSEAAPKLSGNHDVTGLRYFRGKARNGKTSVGSAYGRDSVTGEGVCYIQTEFISEPSSKGWSLFRCCRKKNTLNISPVCSPSRWKAIKIVVFTTGCFFFTWFPYFFACTLFVVCDAEHNPFYCDNLRVAIASPLAILGLVNSLLNPIIYAWWHNGFRESAKRIFNGIWKRSIKTKLNTLKRIRSSERSNNCQQPSVLSKVVTAEEPHVGSSSSTGLDSLNLEEIPCRNSNAIILGVLEPLQKQI